MVLTSGHQFVQSLICLCSKCRELHEFPVASPGPKTRHLRLANPFTGEPGTVDAAGGTWGNTAQTPA